MPKLLEYALGDGIHAFSTMRADGTSQGAYAHFNINPYCGDNPEHVAQNLDLSPTCLACASAYLQPTAYPSFFTMPNTVQRLPSMPDGAER